MGRTGPAGVALFPSLIDSRVKCEQPSRDLGAHLTLESIRKKEASRSPSTLVAQRLGANDARLVARMANTILWYY